MSTAEAQVQPVTPTPPEGMAYVPDFLEMPYEQARDILIAMGATQWYYVAALRHDVDEWTIFQQEPEPGTLVELEADRIKLVLAVYEFTPTPSDPRGPSLSCSDIPNNLCLDSLTLAYCFNNILIIKDCREQLCVVGTDAICKDKFPPYGSYQCVCQ